MILFKGELIFVDIIHIFILFVHKEIFPHIIWILEFTSFESMLSYKLREDMSWVDSFSICSYIFCRWYVTHSVRQSDIFAGFLKVSEISFLIVWHVDDR